MKIAIVYYSRTGYTERVVNELGRVLVDEGFTVEVHKVLPMREYSKPLHVNPRLVYDTLVRRGTSIKFEPSELKLDGYDAIIVASPIWIGTLSSPIQEFLKKHAAMRQVVAITTSIRSVKAASIERIVERLCGAKLLFCVNIRDAIIRDTVKLREVVQGVIENLKAITRKE